MWALLDRLNWHAIAEMKSLTGLRPGFSGGFGGFGGCRLFADAGEEFAGGFVGAGFAASEVGFGGDQFAPEGFGQDRLRQPVDPRPGGGQLGFQPVGEREQLLDPPDDLVLFGEGREGDFPSPDESDTQIWLITS